MKSKNSFQKVFQNFREYANSPSFQELDRKIRSKSILRLCIK